MLITQVVALLEDAALRNACEAPALRTVQAPQFCIQAARQDGVSAANFIGEKLAQLMFSEEKTAAARRKFSVFRGESANKGLKKLHFPYENMFFSSSIALATGE